MNKPSERLVLCCECRNKFPKSELIQYSKTKRMCPACYETRGEELKYYNILKDYICKARNIEIPLPFDLKQVENLRKEGYTSRKIGYTLNYMLTLKGIPMDKYTISNVKYYYHEAEEFAKRQEKLEEIRQQRQFIPKEDRTLKEFVVEGNKGRHRGRLDNTRWIDLSKVEVKYE